MKVYICGNYKDEKAFADAEERLRNIGHVPISPLKISQALPQEINNSDFTVIAYELIRISDGVCLLSGWDKNLFARMEVAHAKRNEKKIFHVGALGDDDRLFQSENMRGK